MDGADDIELRAVRSAFCMVVARWRLTQSEVRLLLDLDDTAVQSGCVLPYRLDADAETRLRMLVRLDAGMAHLIADGGDMADWLRTAAAAYDGATPLAAFADLPNLRAVVRVVEGRLDGE